MTVEATSRGVATSRVVVAAAAVAEVATGVEVGVVEEAATSATLGGIVGQQACRMEIISPIGMAEIGVDVGEVVRAVVSRTGSVTCPGMIGGRSRRGRARLGAGVSVNHLVVMYTNCSYLAFLYIGAQFFLNLNFFYKYGQNRGLR